MDSLLFIALLFYSCSLILRFIHIFGSFNQKRGYADLCLFIGGMIQLGVFLMNFWNKGYFPLLTIYDVLYFYSFIMMILVMIIQQFFRVELFEIFMILIGLSLLFAAISIGETSPTIDQHFLSRFLFMHIALTLISYGIFSLSAVFSGFFLLYERLLKRKKWNLATKKMPSLQRIEMNTFIANWVGTLFMFLGILFGSIWATSFFQWNFFYDPKVMTSILVLFMYIFYLFQHQRKNWGSKQLSQWNVLSFLSVLANFLVAQFFGTFHHWL